MSKQVNLKLDLFSATCAAMSDAMRINLVFTFQRVCAINEIRPLQSKIV